MPISVARSLEVIVRLTTKAVFIPIDWHGAVPGLSTALHSVRLFDESPEAHGHGKIVGGGMVGPHADHKIGDIALAIEIGANVMHNDKTIHSHPTLWESIGIAAEVGHGSLTNVPPHKN